MSLVKEYFRLTQKYKNEYGEKTILLYQVGAFFEVYGLQDKSSGIISVSQITEFCRICDLNIAEKNMNLNETPVFMAGFSHYMLDKYLKRLQEEGYTAVVYKQEELDKTTRSLFGIFSAGTYFSEDSQQITNNTICIWHDICQSVLLKKKMLHVGMSNINIYTGECSLFEYQTEYIKSPTAYDEVERFVSIYNPSEVILITSNADGDIDDIISYANIQCKSIHHISLSCNATVDTDMKKQAINCQKQTYQSTILQKFYGIDNMEQQQQYYQYTTALQSLCFLLDFIHQHNPNLVRKIRQPKFENCTDRLILANHSLKQLNIISDSQGYNGRYSSVEKLLNVCITPMGRRQFAYNLLNPTTNVQYLQEEYDITEHVLRHYNKYEFLKPQLSSIKDISKLRRQSVIKKISPKSISQLYKNLILVKELPSLMCVDADADADADANTDFQKYITKRMANATKKNIETFCSTLIDFLESNFDICACQSIDSFSQFETNFIQKGVDKELDEKISLYELSSQKLETIRCDFNKIISKCEKERKKDGQGLGQGQAHADYVKLHETEKNSISLVSTKRRCEILKKASTSTLSNLSFHHQSASNDFITSPEITELCSNISTIKIGLKDIISKVYVRLMERLQDYQEQLETIIEYITILDLIYAKATLAKTMNYCKPQISALLGTTSFVDAKMIRHPLIERIQQNELYVANDIALGIAEQKAVLLYGVNMVGKTSLIKSIGIAVIMAQAGLFVPASSFVYYPYKYVFTRILNNDNLFKGLSTFAVEMSELRTILKFADEKSLILGDEIASGSESSSAISIFIAALKNLYAKQSSFIFATHMHEIIAYEEITEMTAMKMKHLEVEYNREKDALIYNRVLQNGSGSSNYGLEVAKYLKLPDEFLEDANRLRLKYFSKAESVLSLKTSHFNSQKLIGLCEICGIEKGKEVHHLQHQNIADDNGVISGHGRGSSVFHKNHLANLACVCEKCHDKIHGRETNADVVVKMHKKKKTTKGVVLSEI